MKGVLLLKAKYKTDTRLIKEGDRSYLYCISNMKKATSETFEGNSTGSFSLSNEVNTIEEVVFFFLYRLSKKNVYRKG